MKKSHLVLLIVIAVSIGVLMSFVGDLSTYETIASAKQKEGKNVTISVKMDNSRSVEYDPRTNPNFFSFYVVDTLGNHAKVVYHFEKPYDMEKAERIVLKGIMKGDVFDISTRSGIQIKCPSKYKDDPKAAQNNLSQN